jgi:putative transposase
MIDKGNKKLTLTKQCELAGINKSSLYYERRAEPQANIELMNRIDAMHTVHPYYGSRRIQKNLQRDGGVYNIKRIRRLMWKMGINPAYPKRNLSKAAPHHKKYPYLLRNIPITHNNQVWSIDITYIPMSKGFMYLVAVIDWNSRFVLSWKLSNTMTIEFCKECLQEAIDNYGSPKIFNSDQGSQFTSEKFTGIWKENNLEHVQISMDGRGRATDNAFIERVWRSVKQEKIYSGTFEDGTALWLALVEYFNFYNHDRLHQSLSYKAPAEVYQSTVMNKLTVANKEKEAKRNLTTTTTTNEIAY